MQAGWQVPRRSLLWLVAATLVAMLPHLGRQPAWLLAVLAASIGWRYQVWSGRWPLPRWPIKAVLVLMSVVGVLLDYRSLIGVDPAMALLITGCALKTIEFTSPRDFLVLILMAYFIAACNFIYEQEMPTAAYVLFAVTVVTAALITRHQGEVRRGLVNPMLLSGKMMLQAIPLMVLLFVVFPRISPLWSIPQPKNHARTGPSDNMSPGDIAQLSRSTELAFRVTFDGEVPPQRELYWRGLVFDEFDGRNWRMDGTRRFNNRLWQQGARTIKFAEPQLRRSGRTVDYEIILEPTWQNWAFALERPVHAPEPFRRSDQLSLMSRSSLTQRVRYRARSDPQAELDAAAALPSLTLKTSTYMPAGFNPRTHELAQRWRAEAGDDRAFVERVLRWFNQQPFVYTLSPPLLGRDSVDEFLFDARRGFCEHYASSFVVLMRAAGIPARVVVGYQGGEQHAFQDYLLVYQYDAHAWAEVWLPGEGWQRFDPTAAVAPERVESNLQDVMGSEFLEQSSLSLARFRHIDLLNWVRMNWDMLGYHWARLVLGYDSERQFDLMRGLLGKVTPQRMVLFLVAGGGLVVGLVMLSLLRGRVRRSLDPPTREYLRFCQRLARAGMPRRTGEGPQDYAARVVDWRPELAPAVQSITRHYVELSFGSGEDFDALRAMVRRFRVTA